MRNLFNAIVVALALFGSGQAFPRETTGVLCETGGAEVAALGVSTDPAHWYAVLIAGDGKYFLIHDGLRVPSEEDARPGYDLMGWPVFSPDGSHLAFAATVGTKQFVVLDGQEGPEYDEVNWLTFSPDGSSLAYVARKKGAYLVVSGGQEGPEYDGIWGPVFSRDGSLAYAAQKGKKVSRSGMARPRRPRPAMV